MAGDGDELAAARGGFSEIWLSENRTTKEMVAIKVVQLVNEDFEPDEVATLLAEAKFLRTLDCPYLLKCYETTATEEWLVMVLEYLSGGEMLDHIHKVKKYTEAEAGKLFAQVVSAASYLHNLNLIHRDFKPENIMFAAPVEVMEAEARPLRVKVIDLGMAALYDPKKPACDIYALGVVLFIMLTGRKPHGGQDIRNMTYCNKSIMDAPGLKDERFLSLSNAARDLLLAMLADDYKKRPSAADVLRHPFIAAVDATSEAHREMGEVVRRRMRELAQLRRMHGLRFALRVSKPVGGDHNALLEALDRRRLKFKGCGSPTASYWAEPCVE
ncbi:hypothetical protein GPECTOR_3g469 [Gonium pectorale]|uniref:Protein kinase domain-containing protein n=1 Tax=Gonium pectorale TaxID=33097 RepID=A0A150GZJ1_GONPE|nr:hypothetical protein GPECTOR_3g469 [Gonium pectorale]|eukprot:KXZ55337.1 hypothetical protein GPECTOR_3g469 [Gonium pectorale]